MGFWVSATIAALCEFILASSCAIWYFTLGTGQKVFSPVLTSIKRAIINHFGSLVFGSLILAIVQTVRVVLEYIRNQLEASGAENNKCLLWYCI
jgi:hypothetical protein